MRFVCDHDVAADVATRLTQLGHQAWTASQAGLGEARDDELTAYAIDKNAVLITHDREFSQRRRRSVIGRHVWLRCREWEAADLLAERLGEVAPQLENTADLFVAISRTGLEVSRAWQ